MKTSLLEQTSQIKTMTSLEIAELTGKNHNHILRDIRKMVVAFQSAEEANPNLDWHCESGTYADAQGKRREMFRLDKTTTTTMLSGYDVVARHKINTRWQQLETERFEEENNPELAVERGNQRATRYYQKQGKTADWIGQRIISITIRKAFTAALKGSGVKKEGYRNCTNAIYGPLFGGSSAVVRHKLDVAPSQSIRDNMDMVHLSATMLSESLAIREIKNLNLKGNAECELACNRVSRAVAKSIVTVRKQ